MQIALASVLGVCIYPDAIPWDSSYEIHLEIHLEIHKTFQI